MNELAVCRKRSSRGRKSALASFQALTITAAVAFVLSLGAFAFDEAYAVTDSIVASKLQQTQKKLGIFQGNAAGSTGRIPRPADAPAAAGIFCPM